MQIIDSTPISDNCRYCLMCRHVCPVGHVTRRESLTPHGWGLLIASVERGLIAWDEKTVDVLYACADCGTCRANCVTDQALPDAIALARQSVISAGLMPDVVADLDARLRQFGNPYGEPSSSDPVAKAADALFVGDDAKHAWSSALDAALSLLERAGVKPALIGVGRNSGYLPASLGLYETAKSIAEANLAELAATGARRLFVLSAGDYDAFARLYDERLGLALPDGVEVIEVVSFLSGAAESGRLRLRAADGLGKCAYVDPTHAVRVASRHEAPRRLLGTVVGGPPVELFWRRERAHPSGNTALQFTQPKISNHLTYSRLDDAKNVGAETVVTECSGTLAQLAKHAPKFGVRVQGLYELLAANVA
ncbi:(Fe-S)-binding protein [Candidatus Poribacteria bacterium]|nr:(Fe-S)-binding protein [Candidatus Poribacteria bacterium]